MSGPCLAAKAATSLAESWAGSCVTHSTVMSGYWAASCLLKSMMNGFQAAPLSYQMTTFPLGPAADAGAAPATTKRAAERSTASVRRRSMGSSPLSARATPARDHRGSGGRRALP
jgi:hypothetical protein